MKKIYNYLNIIFIQKLLVLIVKSSLRSVSKRLGIAAQSNSIIWVLIIICLWKRLLLLPYCIVNIIFTLIKGEGSGSKKFANMFQMKGLGHIAKFSIKTFLQTIFTNQFSLRELLLKFNSRKRLKVNL